MPKIDLPPLLFNLNQLADVSMSPGLQRIGVELDATRRAIEKLRAIAPEAVEIVELEHMREGPFTGPSGNECPCCRRPF